MPDQFIIFDKSKVSIHRAVRNNDYIFSRDCPKIYNQRARKWGQKSVLIIMELDHLVERFRFAKSVMELQHLSMNDLVCPYYATEMNVWTYILTYVVRKLSNMLQKSHQLKTKRHIQNSLDEPRKLTPHSIKDLQFSPKVRDASDSTANQNTFQKTLRTTNLEEEDE